MKERLKKLMDYCLNKGADYADIRVKNIETESITTENGNVKEVTNSRSFGYGIRIFRDGAMGFAASSDFAHLEETAKRALEIADASAILQNEKIILAPKPTIVDDYITPIIINPFDVPISDKISLLMNCETAMRTVAGVTWTNACLDFRREESIYCDSCGSYIIQTFFQSGGGISATAVRDNCAETRSYPAPNRGSHARAGYEYVKSLRLKENAENIARESVELLHAPECPTGVYDLIIDSNQMVLQIHESVGHPTELDRILGYEAAYAGATFVRTEFLQKPYTYASPYITIVADAAYPGGLGTFGYDDEGVMAERTVLIDKGILKGFTTSRDTASKIGQISNGTCISDGWRYSPIVRMTNINILPGDVTLDELIEGINEGFLFSGTKCWSIDDKRINFQFACEIAYEIKNGRKTGRIFKNPIYSGITTQFWKSCDGVADEKSWSMGSVLYCGKGQPDQTARVGHGAAPARFRKVKVGVGNVR